MPALKADDLARCTQRLRTDPAYIGRRTPDSGITRRLEVLEAGSLQASLLASVALVRDDLKSRQVENTSHRQALELLVGTDLGDEVFNSHIEHLGRYGIERPVRSTAFVA